MEEVEVWYQCPKCGIISEESCSAHSAEYSVPLHLTLEQVVELAWPPGSDGTLKIRSRTPSRLEGAIEAVRRKRAEVPARQGQELQAVPV